MRAKYVLSEVMIGLWRNVTMTIAMIITMGVSLTMLGSTLVLYHQIGIMKDTFVSKLSVSVYLVNNLDETTEQALQAKISQNPLVVASSVQYISQHQAYEEFKQIDGASYPNLVASTQETDLPASIRLKLADPNKFDQFDTQFKGETGVRDIQNQVTLLNKVFKVLGAIRDLAAVLAIAQGIAALMLVANTIQVAAYSKRREVAVMKLVGASNWFIQAPFVLEAMFAGIIGAIVAAVALVCAKAFLIDGSLSALQSLLGNIQWSYITLEILPILIVAGALVSGVAGWITLRAYIRK